jgi:hypothetical protein
MNYTMDAAQARLGQLLEANEITAGMYVRVYGKHLIAGRMERTGPDQTPENSDRVRFTRFAANSYGLSVRRHTGRWERTPFGGTLEEMVSTVCALMQHLVAT